MTSPDSRLTPHPQDLYIKIVGDKQFRIRIQLPVDGWQKTTLRQAILPGYAQEINEYLKKKYNVAVFDLFVNTNVYERDNSDESIFSSSSSLETPQYRNSKIMNGFDFLIWKTSEFVYLQINEQFQEGIKILEDQERPIRRWFLPVF